MDDLILEPEADSQYMMYADRDPKLFERIDQALDRIEDGTATGTQHVKQNGKTTYHMIVTVPGRDTEYVIVWYKTVNEPNIGRVSLIKELPSMVSMSFHY